MSDAEVNEMQFKMSKKIAQLTKVIYQLNCRNEDNDGTIKNINDRYENEIAEIMTDAKEKIQTLKTALDSKKEEDKVQMVIKEMTRKHEKEKNDAMRVFEEFKSKALQNETNAKRSMDERVTEMSRELTSAKNTFEKKLQEMKDQSASANSSASDALNKLRTDKDKEIDDLVKEYNDRYKAMLSEQMNLQDELEKRLNTEWQQKLDELTNQLGGQSADLSKFLAEEKKKSQQLQKELDDANGEIKKLKATQVQNETEITRLKGREEHLTTNLDQANKDLAAANELETTLRTKIKSLEDQLATMNNSSASDNDRIKGLEATNGKLTSQVANLENEVAVLTKERNELQAAVDAAAADKERLGKQGGALTEELAKLQDTLRSTDDALTEEKALTAKLQKEIEKLKADHAAAVKALEDQIAKLKNQMDAMGKDANSSSEAMSHSHKQELAKLKEQLEQHAAQMLDAKEKEFAKKLQATIEEMEKKLADAVAEAEKKKDAIKAEELAKMQQEFGALKQQMLGDAASQSGAMDDLNKKIAALKEEHAKALKDQDAQFKKELEAERAKLAEVNAQLEAELNKGAEALKDRIKAMEDKLNQAQETNSKLEKEIAKQKEEMEALRKKHQEDMEALKTKHAKELDDALGSKAKEGQAAMDSELAKLRRELNDGFEREKGKIAAAHREEVATLKDQSDTEIARLKAVIADLEERLEKLKATSANSTGELNDQISSLQKQLSDERAAHEAHIAAKEKEHSALLIKTKTELTEKYEAEISKLKNEHAETIAKLNAEFDGKFNNLSETARCNQEQTEASYKERLASLEKKLTEEKEKALRELQEKLSGELQRAQDTFNGDLEKNTAAREALDKEVKALSLQCNDFKSQLEKLKARHEQECNQHAATRRELAEAKEQHAADMRAANDENKDRIQKALALAKEKHDEAVAEMEHNFAAERAELQQNIKDLKRRVAEIEYKYANRESRSEDVAKINELLQSCKEKDEALIKAYNDMKFYKLELVNREESYNKVFGRQPSVAGGAGGAPGGDQLAAGAATSKPANPSSAPTMSAKAAANDAHLPPSLRGRSKSLKK